jgi:uncharacterized protein
MLVQIETPTAPSTRFRRQAHVFETVHGFHALIVDGSRVYSVDEATARKLESEDANAVLQDLGLGGRIFVGDEPPETMAVRSLSLAVAQKCNLACTYCYAQEGSFGSEPRDMDEHAARRAVELLFENAGPGESVNLAFLGGEPLVNRRLIVTSTEQAAALGRARGVRVNYSITTNGTLLTPDDGRFFEEHGFAVTISLDGVGEVHDGLRPFRGGQGSYGRIIDRVRPLLAAQHRMQVSARVTVTPHNLELKDALDELLGLGFHSVGFSPMLSAPTGRGEMDAASLDRMLSRMIECGEEFERRTLRRERYAFANVATAIREIHKGTHRPYPCGAGGGYFGVSADGGLYACHRFVQDDGAYFGDVWNGIDAGAQSKWLRERHVHRQSPCSDCWARYMCGGGCHHEVIHRGRPACDYIRGWLDYCLKAYVRLKAALPEYFD